MAPYDSDSSGDESDGDYTETNVLLGYASKEPTDDPVSQLGGSPTWLDPSTPPSLALAKCATCNSAPALLLQLDANIPDRFPGHERRLYVFACRRKACRRKAGSVRAVRAVRVSAALAAAEQKKKAEAEAKKAAEKERKEREEEERKKGPIGGGIGGAVFGVAGGAAGANPFAANPFAAAGSGGNANANANPFASPSASGLAAKPAQAPAPAAPVPAETAPEEPSTPASTLPASFAEKARIGASSSPENTTPAPPHEPWPPASALPAPYPSYHLDADYETLSNTLPSIPQNTRLDPDAAEPTPSGSGSSSGGGKEDKEAFESTLDKTFQRFADRLAQNPEQVLRYEFNGHPLLYSRDDAVGKAFAPASQNDSAKVRTAAAAGAAAKAGAIPRCANCGAGRVFECQLVPQAIAELEAEELGLEGMDWGTIVVGVCERDCAAPGAGDGAVGYVEEWAGVQWEEVGGKR